MHRKQYVQETRNLALSDPSQTDIEPLLEAKVEGPFWDLLQQLDLSLAVSREYEHFITLLSGDGGKSHVTALELPHPSGMFYDTGTGELIVSSTRTPNQIFWLRPLGDRDFERDVVPADMTRPDGTVFMPYRSLLLPGTLYIHDIVVIGRDLFATVTGHNFLAKLDPLSGWERVWWPACVDGLGRASFDQNYLQLNSIACGASPETSYYTGFSDEVTGAKPWKAGYGPKGKGVVFDGASRQVLLRGLTCPHSAKLRDGKLWLLNSGYGEVGYVDPHAPPPRYEVVTRLPGFTRGLAFAGDYAFVGLSKVIDFYEPYAPGLKPKETICGIVALDLRTGQTVATLEWPPGYQIYDVQTMPHVAKPILPRKPSNDDGINRLLRYLG
ncbi:DUF4915 domain-containing protein [Pseudolabrys sp. FHR47]|uniref:DUF4915 domain-containing protein n=1 Tax=Pseudolabrys sp. FHR47 TaxID=2562284 RepID=UPI0010BEAD4E|nr:DUF4915 domain-containing protein [Pseudolabrys sp. FHR47]